MAIVVACVPQWHKHIGSVSVYFIYFVDRCRYFWYKNYAIEGEASQI